ncbi:MAG: c-type cytochrome [Gammaproteobacteria bacterium]
MLVKLHLNRHALAATVALSALLAAGPAAASEELMKKSGCVACHTVDKKLLGPGFKEIAAKYKGDATAEAKLAEKVKKGGSGVWGNIPMPPNAAVSDADVKTLVHWILSLK